MGNICIWHGKYVSEQQWQISWPSWNEHFSEGKRKYHDKEANYVR